MRCAGGLWCLAVSSLALACLAASDDNLRDYNARGQMSETSNTCPGTRIAACGPDWEVQQSTTGYFHILPLRPAVLMDGALLQCPSASGTWSKSGSSTYAAGSFILQTPDPAAPTGCQELQHGASCFLTRAVTFSAGAGGGAHSMRVSYSDNGTCTALYQLASSTMDVLGVQPESYSSIWAWSSSARGQAAAACLSALLTALAVALLGVHA